MCDGGSLPWKYLEPFPDGQISDDLDEYKLNTMKYNAWQVCEKIALIRTDDAPGPGRRMPFTTLLKENIFFSGTKISINIFTRKARNHR